MDWSDLKIGIKLLVLASVGIVGTMAVGSMGVVTQLKANNNLKCLNASVHDVASLAELNSALLTARLDLVYMMSLEDSAKLKDKYADYKGKVGRIAQLLKEVQKTEMNDEERDLLTSFKDGSEAYAREGDKLADMLLKAHAARDKEGVATAVAFGIGTVAPLYLKPAKAIADIFEVMACIADGDLTARSTHLSADEMGMLGREINVMGDKPKGIICRLSDNSFSVSSAAEQMHATSDQMSTSTEELAAQAGTLATACEEMAATSSEIARNCHSAANDSALASVAAQTGVT